MFESPRPNLLCETLQNPDITFNICLVVVRDYRNAAQGSTFDDLLNVGIGELGGGSRKL